MLTTIIKTASWSGCVGVNSVRVFSVYWYGHLQNEKTWLMRKLASLLGKTSFYCVHVQQHRLRCLLPICVPGRKKAGFFRQVDPGLLSRSPVLAALTCTGLSPASEVHEADGEAEFRISCP